MLENRHSFDWINIKIMDHETNYFKKLILKMIYIKHRRKFKFCRGH